MTIQNNSQKNIVKYVENLIKVINYTFCHIFPLTSVSVMSLHFPEHCPFMHMHKTCIIHTVCIYRMLPGCPRAWHCDSILGKFVLCVSLTSGSEAHTMGIDAHLGGGGGGGVGGGAPVFQTCCTHFLLPVLWVTAQRDRALLYPYMQGRRTCTYR